MSFIVQSGQNIRILSLDGGDERCLAQLMILSELMNRLSYSLRRTVRPCEYFAHITGVGASGVIAVFLGVLGMTADTALDLFGNLCETVLSSSNNTNKKRSKALKSFMEDVLRKRHIPADAKLKGTLNPSSQCRVALCYSVTSFARCHMFRNYDTRDGDWMEPTIVQAVLGTWATPDLFLPVTIGDPHMAETIHSAARGFNNPTREACLEVSRTLTPNWKAALVLSLGTGKPHPVGAHSNHNTVNLATGVTSGHNQAAFGNHGVFFRFSYPGGTADYDLALITMHTNRYLERTFISKGLDAALSVGSRSGSTPLHTLPQAAELHASHWASP